MCTKEKMERDAIIKLGVVEKIVDKELIEDLYQNESFLCGLLVDTFKSFLSDGSFEKVERQVVLLKFLKNNYPLELSRDVVEYAKNCELSSDYERIIMEWNFFASDFIKQYSLYKYDACQLAFDKQTKEAYEKQKDMNNRQLDIIGTITNLLISGTNEDTE